MLATSPSHGLSCRFQRGIHKGCPQKAPDNHQLYPCPGDTRSNVYIVDEIGHVETGIAESGPYIPEEAMARFLANYERMLGGRTGRHGRIASAGFPQDIYRDMLDRAKSRGIPTLFMPLALPL